ncbi:hypothetical protein IFVP195_C170041 [Vibrio parahaemolyticus]
MKKILTLDAILLNSFIFIELQ